VKMNRAVREYPGGLPEDSVLTMEGKLPFAWVTRDLSRSGVLGDATVATREKGEKLLEAVSDGWIRTIEDVHKFQQPQSWKI